MKRFGMFYTLSVLFAALLLVFSAPLDAAPDRAPAVGREYLIPASETDSAGQHGIHFLEFVNGSARRPLYPFTFQRYDEPLFGELQQRLGLDELLEGSETEFEAVRRIALAVCNRWAHAAPVEYPDWNALAILDRIDRGDQLWCTYKQLVAMQAMASIGIHSRIVPCQWHHSLEFWSNEYAKWVVIDAWTGNWYRRDGVPLGTLELHRLTRAHGGTLAGSGVWEMNINPNRWMPERTADSTLAETGVYNHLRYIPRNDFLSSPHGPKPTGGQDDFLQPNNQINDVTQTGFPHIAWWNPGGAPSIVGPVVRHEHDWNFPLNEVEMSFLRPSHLEGALDVSFDTNTPEFESYEMRTVRGEWHDCGAGFRWELEPGLNRLEARTRNRWGRHGPVSRAVIDYRPDELVGEVVQRIEIPDAGFEQLGIDWSGSGSAPAGDTWKLILTEEYQEPEFHGPVSARPHSGKYCYRIELADPPIWAKLASGSFAVNQASDVIVRVWLRADREGRPVTIYINDRTPGGPGNQAIVSRRVRAGRQWEMHELRARLTARTTRAVVGIQVMEGELWADDFSITQQRRADIPWAGGTE